MIPEFACWLFVLLALVFGLWVLWCLLTDDDAPPS